MGESDGNEKGKALKYMRNHDDLAKLFSSLGWHVSFLEFPEHFLRMAP